MLKLTVFANNIFKQTYRSVICTVVREKNVWTSDNVVKSPYQDIIIPNATFSEYVWTNLDKWATKTATVTNNLL